MIKFHLIIGLKSYYKIKIGWECSSLQACQPSTWPRFRNLRFNLYVIHFIFNIMFFSFFFVINNSVVHPFVRSFLGCAHLQRAARSHFPGVPQQQFLLLAAADDALPLHVARKLFIDTSGFLVGASLMIAAIVVAAVVVVVVESRWLTQLSGWNRRGTAVRSATIRESSTS